MPARILLSADQLILAVSFIHYLRYFRAHPEQSRIALTHIR